MKYLSYFDEQISTDGLDFYDLFDYPEFVYGNINISGKKVDFCKYPKTFQEEMDNFNHAAINEMIRYNSASCGNRIRFSTNSSKLVFKIQITRPYSPQKILNYNSRGFDVYGVKNGKYVPIEVFAPMSGNIVFVKSVDITGFNDICIFLPSYTSIDSMHMGIDEGSYLKRFDYSSKLPILFYGNSITQGAAASKSGNAFPNIISRKMDCDIINLSCSSCCKATENIADFIGKINCQSIVIDYTNNASSLEYFEDTYEAFYKKIREYHPNIKVILMTHAETKKYNIIKGFDEIIKSTLSNAQKNNENTYLFDQIKCFDTEDYDLRSVDTGHYTDWGMYEVAKGLMEILTE